ncbi:unnamed protein product [Ectocarpus sp. CCAP 1310/34]|nr:unnamed protein product [Ectocarpus sp. CCAP 1310/34]
MLLPPSGILFAERRLGEAWVLRCHGRHDPLSDRTQQGRIGAALPNTTSVGGAAAF